MNQVKTQKGFIFILVVVVVSIVTALWLSTKHQSFIGYFKSQSVDSDLEELNLVKERLLQFAVLQPEIFLTDSGGVASDEDKIPSPGYFPCPDEDGDGTLSTAETSCFNEFDAAYPIVTGFVPDPDSASGLGTCNGSSVCTGYVPKEISTRNFYFGEAGRYFYFLDERFVSQNPNYNTSSGEKRFAPLHPDVLNPDAGVLSPVLVLNGKPNYVVIIIDPGRDGLLDSENGDGDPDFAYNPSVLSVRESDNIDKVVGISYSEWLAWIARRVCAESGRYLGSDDDYEAISTVKHWVKNYDVTINPRGSNWEDWVSQCPVANYP